MSVYDITLVIGTYCYVTGRREWKRIGVNESFWLRSSKETKLANNDNLL